MDIAVLGIDLGKNSCSVAGLKSRGNQYASNGPVSSWLRSVGFMPVWRSVAAKAIPVGQSESELPAATAEFLLSSNYSVVLPSKCSLSASASSRVWWTTPSR